MGKTPQQRHKDLEQQLAIAKRRRAVAANLAAGATYSEMAEALKVSKATIASDVKFLMQEWRENRLTDTQRFATLQIRRCDVLLNAIWDKAKDGNLGAIDRVLAIINQQNRIVGIDKGVTIENTVNLIQPIQIVEVQRNYLALET